MTSTHKAPKQSSLSKNETINSFENWRQNLLYSLSLDSNFGPFRAETTTLQKTRALPLRGLTDDDDSVPLTQRRSARQKVNFLELILGKIASYCLVSL